MADGATPVALVSLLSVLDPLSGAGLVVGIAYLNLERFRYRKKVREYARHQLRVINPEQEQAKGANGEANEKRPKVELPSWLMGMAICKELHRIAALPDHDGVGDDPDESDKTIPVDKGVALQGLWATTYATLFEHHWDRKVVTFLTVMAGVVLVIGAANAIGVWQFLIPVFASSANHDPNFQTVIVFYLLVAALAVPLVFIYMGKKVVIWGRERVRQLVKDCRIALQGPAQAASLTEILPSPEIP